MSVRTVSKNWSPLIAAASVLAALGCNGATATGQAKPAATSRTPAPRAPGTTSPTAPIATATATTPASSTDPLFYATPAIAGSGVRTINVTPGGTPTLQQAFDAALPGDTIVLAAGTHTKSAGNLVMKSSGTSTAWISIKGAAGSRPVIDLGASGELNLAGSFVLLENVEIIRGGGNNIHVAPVATAVQNLVIRDVKVRALATGPGAAIKLNRNGGLDVELVYIERCDLSEAIGNAIVDGVGVAKCVVRSCDIHDNAVGSHGIFFKGGSSEVLLEKNLVRGIRGNAALQLGGVTGSTFFNPAHASVEGFDQVARNNLIADCDDAIVQVQGVTKARVHHNTAVSQSAFAVFRLTSGNSSTGTPSGNSDVEITNNVIVATGGVPQFARNDGGATTVTFGPQVWAGEFKNSSSKGPSIPAFPQASDKTVAATALATVVVTPTTAGLTGLSDALGRYALASGSPAKAAGAANTIAPKDILDAPRSATAPSIGAFE